MKKMAFCLVSLVWLLGACSSRSEKLVFSAGGAPAEVKAWKRLLKDYEALQPGVEVELRALPASSELQLQSYTTALGSGKASYDLMRLDIVWLAAFEKKGWLEPLDAYLPATDLAAFGPLLERADRIHGKLLALPWNMDLGLLYSRSDLLIPLGFRRPPLSWAELMDMARAVRKSEILAGRSAPEGFVWQGKSYEGLLCNFLEVYADAGGSLEVVEKRRAWEEAPALKSLELLSGFLREGLSPPNTATELTEEPSRLLFQSGRAVFMRNWPYAQALLNSGSSAVKGGFWVSPLPHFNAGKRGAAALGGWHLGVRKDSPRAAQAARLAAWLSAAPQQQRLYKELAWNPSRMDLYQELPQGGAEKELLPLKQAFKGLVSRPRVEDYASFSERSVRIINAVLLGANSPEEGARKLAEP